MFLEIRIPTTDELNRKPMAVHGNRNLDYNVLALTSQQVFLKRAKLTKNSEKERTKKETKSKAIAPRGFHKFFVLHCPAVATHIAELGDRFRRTASERRPLVGGVRALGERSVSAPWEIKA